MLLEPAPVSHRTVSGPGKCSVLELQLHTVTLAASTAGDLEFYSAATLTKKRQMILMVIEDIL